MSIYTETAWPVMDTSAVCALQNLDAAGPLLLNGTLANTSTPSQISFIAANFIRSVSLTSVNNIAAVTFVISGFQNGAFVTESIAGPNNNTVFGTMYYDYITSVVPNGSVTGISVGTGNAGYLPIISVNTNNIGGNVNYSCSVLLPAESGITYTLVQTLESITTNFIAFQNQIGKFFPIPGFTGWTSAITSQIGNSTTITNFILLEITSSIPVTDTFNFIFLQE